MGDTLTVPTAASTERDSPQGITGITVGGFKSIATTQSIEVRPLTILAGANSSGKSSVIQALLLLKQTLDAPYDPGPLMLDGENVTFTSADQLLSRVAVLESVGLARSVRAKKVNDTQFEVQVDWLPLNASEGAPDFLNIADVGFGVPTVLPVLVALSQHSRGRPFTSNSPSFTCTREPRSSLLTCSPMPRSAALE
jgi:predicted ATPase